MQITLLEPVLCPLCKNIAARSICLYKLLRSQNHNKSGDQGIVHKRKYTYYYDIAQHTFPFMRHGWNDKRISNVRFTNCVFFMCSTKHTKLWGILEQRVNCRIEQERKLCKGEYRKHPSEYRIHWNLMKHISRHDLYPLIPFVGQMNWQWRRHVDASAGGSLFFKVSICRSRDLSVW